VRGKVLRHGVRLVGPLLLALVLWKVGDVRALGAALGRARFLPFALACALNAVNVHLKVVRTQLLAGLRGHRYRLRDAWRAMLPSLYLGMVTPGRVGDALRVQYMREDLRTPYAEGLALVVMDRFCDLYVLLGFVAVGVAHFASVLDGRLGTVTWLGVAATALLPALFLVRGPVDALFALVARRLPGIGGDAGPRFLEALRGQVRPRLALAVPLTVAAFLVNYLQGWLVARALGIALGYADVIHMMAITSLLGLLPISMSGAGVRELFLALVFPSLGFSREEGVAFGLLIFAAIYLFCSLAGFIAWQVSPPPFEVSGPEATPDGATRLANPRDPGENGASTPSGEP
jgi:uncharacterized membrane protein YbhN (UPF0104 family)